MFTEVLNTFLNVRNKVKNSSGNWVDMEEKTRTLHTSEGLGVDISADQDYVILNEVGHPIEITSITVGGNSDKISVLLNQDNSASPFVGNLLHTIGSGSQRSSARAERLMDESYRSDYLGIHHYDSSTKNNVIYLKKPILLPAGGKLILRLLTGEPQARVTYRVDYYRLYGGF